MNNTELIERLVELERSMVERKDADIEAFKKSRSRSLQITSLRKHGN